MDDPPKAHRRPWELPMVRKRAPAVAQGTSGSTTRLSGIDPRDFMSNSRTENQQVMVVPCKRGRPARTRPEAGNGRPAEGPPVCSSGVESTTGAVAVGRWRVAVAGGFRPYTGASVHAMAPFPVAARRTGRAALPHPALSGIMPSPTAGRAPSHSDGPSAIRCTTARRGSGSAPCRPPCASCATTGAADAGHEHPRCVSHR